MCLSFIFVASLLVGASAQTCEGSIAKTQERKDCGFNGIDRVSCEAKGCCWSPASTDTPGVPWCFLPSSPTPGPPPGPSPGHTALPLPACVDDGVITLLAARYSGSGLDQWTQTRNCTIRGQPGSVIVGPLPVPFRGSETLRIEGTLQFDAAGRELSLGYIFVRGSVVFKNCSVGEFPIDADWLFEGSTVIFQHCNVTKSHGQLDSISNSTVILIDSSYQADNLQIASSQLNMTRADLRSTTYDIRITDTTMSLISSFISAGGRNRYISIANSVMSLHNSRLLYGGENMITPLLFVNTNATFTGSGWRQDPFIHIDGDIPSTSDLPTVSFVDSWVSFPLCSYLRQMINVEDGDISIKGGRVWCVSNTAMTAKDNAQIAIAVV